MRWRIARRVVTEGTDARIKFVLMTVATALFTCSLVAIALTFGRAEAMAQRAVTVTPSGGSAPEAASFEWASLSPDSVGPHPVQVLAVRSVSGTAPPGWLPRWPAPGEAVLSPQLAAELAEGDRRRFGEPIGLVGRAGLLTLTDRVVYLGTDTLSDEDYEPATGFGDRSDLASMRWLAQVYAPPPMETSWAIAGLWTSMSVVAITLISRIGSAARVRRLRLLRRLGAARRHRVGLVAGEAVFPAIASWVITAPVLAAVVTTPVPLPGLTTVLRPSDARLAAGPLAAAVVAGLVVPVLLGALSTVDARRYLSLPRRRRWPGHVALAAAPLGFLVATVSLGLLPPSLRQLVAYLAGLAVFMLTLPAAMAALFEKLGAAVARSGTKSGRGDLLLAGRRLSNVPHGTALIASAMVVGTLLIANVAGWVSLASEQYVTAVRDQRAFSASLLLSPGFPAAAVDRLAEEISPQATTARIVHVETTSAVLVAACADLRALQLDCRDGTHPVPADHSLARLQHWVSPALGYAQAQPSPSSQPVPPPWLLVAGGTQDSAAFRWSVQRAQYTVAPASLRLRPVGQGWIVGGAQAYHRGQWVSLFGTLGLASLVLGLLGGATTEIAATARDIAPAASIYRTPALLRTMALIRVALPLGLSAGLAFVSAGVFTASLSAMDERWRIPIVAPVAGLLLGVLVTVALTVTACTIYRQDSDRWRPGARTIT